MDILCFRIRPGTGPSMLYEPMMYGQMPSSSAAHIPSSMHHSQLMYQPQYPPQHIANQPRLVPGMWPSSQPGSGQYFNTDQMLGSGQLPRTNQMPGDSHVTGQGHVTGQSHIPGGNPRVAQSLQYPFSLAGGYRGNQEVRSSLHGVYTADMNQSHTLAYFPTSYAGSTPSPQSADPLSMPRYQAPLPQGQGDGSFHGNQMRPSSPAVFQSKQANLDDTYETPVKPDNSLRRSNSHLVLKLQSIPNLEKRRSRLDINLSTLKEEVEELDEKMNKIIVENENFIGDQEYNLLIKQKQKFLRDIKELENYEKELEKMIAENAHDDLGGKETVVQKLVGGTDKSLQGPPNTGLGLGSVRFPPNTATKPDLSRVHQNVVANQNRESNFLQGGQALGSSANQKLQGDANEEEENFRNAEEERKMNEIRKMLLLGQNPFGSKPAKQEQLGLNIPVSEDVQQTTLSSEGVTYPPQIVVSKSSDIQAQQTYEDITKMMQKAFKLDENAALAHKASEPNLKVAGDATKDIRKIPSASDIQQWQCEHCTFLNDHSSNVCSVCYKTNDNKKIIGKSLAENILGEASAVASAAGDVEKIVMGGISGQGAKDSVVNSCKKCTFHNKPGQEKCEMCGEALILVTTPLKIDVVGGGGDKVNLDVTNKPGENKKEAVSPRVTSLEQKLEEEQDQVSGFFLFVFYFSFLLFSIQHHFQVL